MRALIVDDSVTARLLLSYILRKKGFELKEAADGSEALRLLREGWAPDLMTLDWNMPGLGGGAVLEALSHEPGLRPPKVMIVTSETDMAVMNGALATGADEYLMKPYTFESVREKLALLGLEQTCVSQAKEG